MTGSRTSSIVDRLVAAGLLDPARVVEAETVVAGALDEQPTESAPLRRRMAEIAGYVGAAFVVGAAWLFLSQTWADLGLTGQVGLLFVSAVALAAGGLLLARAAGRSAEADPLDDIRGRLASVLLAGAGACAAFGVGIWVDDALANTELVVMLAALTGLIVVLVGYVVMPSPVGQAAAAVAAFVTVPAGLGALPSDSTSPVPLSLSVLALGALWLLLAERKIWRERTLGRLLGCALAFVGAQMALPGQHSWVAYVATAAVGALAFGLYVGTRAWPYLLTGVLAVTVAVPEALYDWAEGSLGAAGILLVTGVTLLAAALAGLRLRHEVTG
jgi:FtsH-binding integral membrane protein